MAKAEVILENEAAPVCEKFGVYVYDTEYKKEGSGYVLRLFIDKEEGVTVEDCEKVSRELNPVLDEKFGFISDPYLFEVSSPGMDRKLSKDWHFTKAIGKNVDIKTFAPFNGSKAFTAKLLGYDHGILLLELNGEKVRLEKGKTSVVRMAVEF